MDLERRAKYYLEYILFCIFNIVARNVMAENSKGETMKKTLSKAGYAIQCVAGELCKCDVGDKIPTVTELEEQCGCSRGNIQKALSVLKEAKVIALEAHGQNGTYVTKIDYVLIANVCDKDIITGLMPLPYTTRYEGLATGLLSELNECGEIKGFLSFARGSENRIEALKNGFVDYVVLSRFAAEQYIASGFPLKIVLRFGPHTYVGRHVLLARQDSTDNQDLLKVGIDVSSADQSMLTKQYFKRMKVDYVPVQYMNIVKMLDEKSIDVGIWNEDDIHVLEDHLDIKPLYEPDEQSSNNEAVIVTLKNDALTQSLIAHLVDKERVLNIQKKVMSGNMLARY